MKRVQFLALAFAVALGITGYAHAQDTVSVNVPFAFQIADQNLQPGDYTVFRMLSGVPTTLAFRNKETQHVSGLAMTNVGDGNGEPALLFDVLGGQYFLTDIRTSGATYHLPRSRAEASVARALFMKNGDTTATQASALVLPAGR